MTNCKKTVVYVGLQSLIKRGVGLQPICKIIENSAELPPMRKLVFSDQSADKKIIFFNKNSFTSNFNFKLQPFWSHNADSWSALCKAKFTIADIKAPV